MKYNLVFIRSVHSVKLMYTTNYKIPSCYDDTKSKYIFFCQIPSYTCAIYHIYGANSYFNR